MLLPVEESRVLVSELHYTIHPYTHISLGQLRRGNSIAVAPAFCVVEARQDEAFGAGQGELLGQMLALSTEYGYVFHHYRTRFH
jgi:hypothetical protein